MKKYLLILMLTGCHEKSKDIEITTDAGMHFKAHLFSDQSILNVAMRPSGLVWSCYEPTGDTGDIYCGNLTKQDPDK